VSGYTVPPDNRASGNTGHIGDHNNISDDLTTLISHVADGLTGATQGYRLAGATTSGPPASGTFALGDIVLDRTTPTLYVCTTAGTVGSGAAFTQVTNAFTNPMTTLGDLIYENATPAAARLAGNTTTTKKYLQQTGDGTNSAAPAWGTIAAGDVPTLNQNTTGTAAGLSATLAIGSGGTGATSAAAAYNNLSPMTTKGDIEYESGSNTAARLAGNTTTTKKFLTQTGDGSASAAPGWNTIVAGDLPTVPIAQGGTGQTTAQAALNALAAAQTNHQVLAGDGTNVTLRALTSADLPAGSSGGSGAVQIDGTAGDFLAEGKASAGSSSLVAAADHVHPANAWQANLLSVSGCLAETFTRYQPMTTTGAITSGTVFMTAIPLYANMVVANITFMINGAGSSYTHGWFVLTDSARVVHCERDEHAGDAGVVHHSVIGPVLRGDHGGRLQPAKHVYLQQRQHHDRRGRADPVGCVQHEPDHAAFHRDHPDGADHQRRQPVLCVCELMAARDA
jgi:hypothetical protein